ncbi:hypothetical protein J3F84DRAFT_386011 [Trichoderma pleuroticola]
MANPTPQLALFVSFCLLTLSSRHVPSKRMPPPSGPSTMPKQKPSLPCSIDRQSHAVTCNHNTAQAQSGWGFC